jgi:hypothetical protein
VTSPRTGQVRRRRASAASEIDAQTRLGEIYMTSLLRAQFRLAVLVILALAVGAGGLPLLFLLWPGLAATTVAGVPIPWLVLGVAAYPLLLLLGWLYVRAAERNERDFADVVERS